MVEALHVLLKAVHKKECKQKAQQHLRVNVSGNLPGGAPAGPTVVLGSARAMLLDGLWADDWQQQHQLAATQIHVWQCGCQA